MGQTFVFEIWLAHPVRAFLESPTTPPETREGFYAALAALEADPYPNGTTRVPLNFSNYNAFRHGQLLIAYAIEDDATVLKIAHVEIR